MRSWWMAPLMVVAIGCSVERAAPTKTRSLDGFLEPYGGTPDLAPPAVTGATTSGGTTTGATTSGGTTAGSTTAGSTTAGSTTAGSTTAGSTTAGSTTAGSTTAGSTTAGATTSGGGGLDPLLALPSGSGTPCNTPGQDCANLQGCRIYSTTESRCEAGGSSLWDQICTTTADCDIDLTCYNGRCEGFCALGANDCGTVPSDCIDVGYAGGMGVCKN
jgi:hypothetical protein